MSVSTWDPEKLVQPQRRGNHRHRVTEKIPRGSCEGQSRFPFRSKIDKGYNKYFINGSCRLREKSLAKLDTLGVCQDTQLMRDNHHHLNPLGPGPIVSSDRCSFILRSYSEDWITVEALQYPE